MGQPTSDAARRHFGLPGDHGAIRQHEQTVHASSPRAADELDEKWHHRASASALYGDKGEFLILPPLSGGSEIGWVAVTDPGGEHLPSRIAAVTGSPELLAVSMDGHHLCAASAEEDDYWVVQHEFSDAQSDTVSCCGSAGAGSEVTAVV
ncbi:hypothetical protein ACFY3M_35905 [Streptomyces mirabilis]|uniref:hypothetical protein n=1 Tax=Streptomyces mirabilis TaxID=68239 RepID=UPI0036BD8CCA